MNTTTDLAQHSTITQLVGVYQQAETDIRAALASVALVPLISWEGAPDELFFAYATIVRQMQPHTRPLAYHAIAAELDWGHRRMIWENSGLASEIPTTRCQFE